MSEGVRGGREDEWQEVTHTEWPAGPGERETAFYRREHTEITGPIVLSKIFTFSRLIRYTPFPITL